MRSVREMAASAMRSIRGMADTAELAADSVFQAAGLLSQILDSTTRLVRGVTVAVDVLVTGGRRLAIALVHLRGILGELYSLFTPESLRRYRREYRRERRAEEAVLRMCAREVDRAVAEEERVRRRSPQPAPAPGAGAYLPRRPRRRRHSDYPSTSSDSSSSASDGSPASSGWRSDSSYYSS